MADCGADLDAVRARRPAFPPGSVGAYLELHIEQGPVLEAAGLPVGIVTGIRGNARCREVRCLGAYGHAGAVPRALRRDAVLASVEVIAALERRWREIEAAGGDLVMTVGRFTTDPEAHSLATIPGEARFSFDARSHETAVLDDMVTALRSACENAARGRGVRFERAPITRAAPALMDPGLRARAMAACEALDVPAREMASGPGHDATDFAQAGIPSAMIFVRNQHGSHNPRESMRIEDFREATRVLLHLIADLAGPV